MVAKIVNSMVTEITGDLKKVLSHEPLEAAFCGLSWQKNSRRCVSSPWDIGGRGMRRNTEGDSGAATASWLLNRVAAAGVLSPATKQG
jgi:hypothetical protein